MFCALIRWRIWRRPGGGQRASSGWTERHIARCPSCRQERDRARILEHRLRLGAALAEPPDLSAVALPGSSSQVAARAGRRRRRVPLIAGASSALAAAVVVLALNAGERSSTPTSEAPDSAPTAVAPPIEAHLAKVGRITDRASAFLQDAALDQHLSQSLERELENLTTDAKHGFRYVLRVGGLK